MRDEILIYNDSGTGDIRPLRDSLREYFSPQGIKIDTVTADEIIKNLMKAVGKAKSNQITTFARGLTSVPGLLTTFFGKTESPR